VKRAGTTNNMNILMITPGYPPAIGGIETHVYQLSKQIQNEDLELHVLWLNGSDHEPVQSPTDPDVTNGNIQRTEDAPPITVQNYHHIKRAIDEVDPDLVHAHSLWYSYAMAPLLLRPSALKFVVTNHSSSFLRNYYSDSALTNLKLRFAGRWPDICIAPSRELQQTTGDIASAPVTWIPNGVNVDEFSPDAETTSVSHDIEQLTEDSFVVLTTRRFEPKNGMRHLVKSIPHTAEDIYFVMIGDGSNHAELKQWVEEQGLSHRVSMPGSVPHDEIAAYYQLADVSVLPSLKEAISISGLESMASGTPLIGTRVGGIPELIDHGENGLLVQPRSPEEIAEAINRLHDNPREVKEMGTKARAKVVDSFSWDAVAERTIEVYKSVL
jgi:glycosyltransferase involved in cell wall biosynthesis